MTLEPRARDLSKTLFLARKAARIAGVTRIGDVSRFAVPGIPVFQAIRPFSKSLSVSQGKGITPMAGTVGALLEAVELWAAENLQPPTSRARLIDLDPSDRLLWSGDRHALALSLASHRERYWLDGLDLFNHAPCKVPFDLLSLDFTQHCFEFSVTSNGLACGNNDDEARASGVAELLEHHCCAQVEALSPRERCAQQVVLATIDDPVLIRLIRHIQAAGFQLRAWSIGDAFGIAAFQCLITETKRQFDDLAPSAGSGCHPDRRVAFARAMLEAVQSRATLFAGARDDLEAQSYAMGRQQEFAVLLSYLGFGEGSHRWHDIPTREGLDAPARLHFLLQAARSIADVPVVAFKHQLPVEGLSLWHCLAPGLMDLARANEPHEPDRRAPTILRARRRDTVLFAGPSLYGLDVADDIEVRPPAVCGDLAALLDKPPATVALIDGFFRTARTTWHKEILSLLAAGVRVIGGASLGAIRAAELDVYGMEGIGDIYDAYRRGTLIRDDAVLICHAPRELGYAPMTTALVDAEFVLAGLDVEERDRRMMQRIVRTTDYTVRTWRHCRALFTQRTGRDFPVPADQLERCPSIKRHDAERILEAMRKPRTGAVAACAEPPRTFYYEQLLTNAEPVFAQGST
ncbi:YcaO-like protein with predicted kinase domain [Novosphingobium sp. PhB165]|uniref:YcaO-like family protein n=1 Tax=Novosphingobium sp. PhB165 TaxID=2485105 RepID=UPI0010433EBF|nr:YcaO-like family protein [Novosphingobium sp. PhB165]TCM20438.1 YcaO-like protein with predicted kinase domain [Novosphingobium sp. PhB165]